MAFPTVTDVTAGDTAVSTTRTITLPTGIVEKDLLLAFHAAGQSMSHTWPAGWTELFDVGGFSGGYRVADGSEDGSTIDVTSSAAARAGAYMVHCFTGGSFIPPEQSNATFSNTAAADCPNLDFHAAGASIDSTWMAVAMCLNAGGDNGGVWPTDYNDNQLRYPNSTGGLSGCIISSTRNLAAASENPGAYPVLGNSGRAFTIGIALATPSLVYNSRRNHHLLVR